MPKLKLIVFDIDGTLVDTSEFIYQAYEHVLRHHSLPTRKREEIATQIGKKIEDCYAFLAPGFDVEKLIETHVLFQEKSIKLIRPFAGADVLLGEIRKRGIKTVLWTGRRHYVKESLEICGLNHGAFDGLITADEVLHSKPHPEGLQRSLALFRTTPDQAIMVGDAGLDMLAGKNAGVAATVGITHGFGTKAELESVKADYIIDSLAELPAILAEIK